MKKLIKGLFYIFFSLCGGIAGWSIYEYLKPILQNISPELSFVHSVIFTVVGIIFGISFSSALSDYLLKLIENVAKQLLTMSTKKLAGGAVGLIIGLVTSSLSIYIISTIPFEFIPFGRYIYSLFSISIAILICYISIYLGAIIIGQVSVSPEMLNSANGLELFWGGKQKIVDTSVIIDGRIYDILKTGFIDDKILVPRFVLAELQTLADSADDLKRTKGRKGLDLLEVMKKEFDFEIIDKDYDGILVDDKLLNLATELHASLLTNDYNLNKVATVKGIEVLNINELANALKPAIHAGEILKVNIIKAGKEPNQGIAYLENGTMIVVENGKKYIGEDAIIEVTSYLQTSAGKMVFSKIYQNKKREK